MPNEEPEVIRMSMTLNEKIIYMKIYGPNQLVLFSHFGHASFFRDEKRGKSNSGHGLSERKKKKKK